MFEKDKYIGTKIGRLFVKNIHHIGASRNKFYNCVCDCGKNTIVARSQLSTKQTISCGCYREEHKHEFGFKHGMSNTKIYHIWSAMCQRCTNPKADNYYRYGGRGIKIYDKWLSFIDFYKWALSNGYKNGLSIERIDVNGNYCPENGIKEGKYRERKLVDLKAVYSTLTYTEDIADKPVEAVLIRENGGEWREPLVEAE